MLFTKLSKRLALCLKKSQGKGAGTRGHRTYTRKKENIPAKKDMKHLVFMTRRYGRASRCARCCDAVISLIVLSSIRLDGTTRALFLKEHSPKKFLKCIFRKF